MFHAARLKLTFWYLLIIMFISISFSVVVYHILTVELDRVEHFQDEQRERVKRLFFFKGSAPDASPTVVTPLELMLINHHLIEETKQRLVFRLLLINVGILALSGVAGYFLAGRTLRPIQEMVDDQKRFITDASHELRTPLTALRTELEVALRDKTLTPQDAKLLLKSNLEEVITLQSLSDNLIMLTNHNSNQVPYKTISLLDVIERSLKKVIPLARKKEIHIDNKIEDVLVTGDKQSLSQLFVILLDNAIKYSESGKNVVLTSQKSRKQVVIQIADQGIGIAKKEIPYIFERFYRADASRSKSEMPGYGLGLAIAQDIVVAHGGTIKVASKLNIGTTFTLRFPIKQTV